MRVLTRDKVVRRESETTMVCLSVKKRRRMWTTTSVLQEKHGKDKQFTTPFLCLWARTISAGLHDDFDSPPDLPAFLQ